MKSLLTVVTGTLILAASGVSACPLMENVQQQATKGDQQNQPQQSLVEKKVNKVDSKLVVTLSQKLEKTVN